MSLIFGRAGINVQDMPVPAQFTGTFNDGVVHPCEDDDPFFVLQSDASFPGSGFESKPSRIANGRFLLCFDGRLDNREDIAQRLDMNVSETTADCALVAAAWARWLGDSLHYLLGDFTIAVWDSLRRELTLTCDAGTGGHPLYYHEASGHISFANNLALLLQIPDVPRDLDLPVIAASAHWQWPAEGRTWYRHIRQLPPAGRLSWSRSGCRVDCYWQPDRSHRVRFARDADYVDAARELLDQAVAAHCRVSGPLVCELSGGLDSTAVAATAARLNPSRPIHCITVVPDGNTRKLPETGSVFHDEWSHAEAVARLYPNIIPLRVMAKAPTAADLDYAHCFARLGCPVSNLYDKAWFGAARQQVRELGAGTVLAGTSGNLTLSYNGMTHLTDLVRQCRWPSLFRHATELGHWPGLRGTRLLRRALRNAWLPDAAPDLGPAVCAPYRRTGNREKPDGPQTWCERRLLFDRLVEGRRQVASFARYCQGIEVLDPLGYRRLLEFCLAIPPEQYLADGMPRSLARRVLADRLPACVIKERRRGRQAPELSTTIWNDRLVLRAALDDMARSEAVSDILDITWLRALFDKLPSSADRISQADAVSLRLAVAAMAIGQFILWVEAGSPGLDITDTRAGP